MPIYLAESTQPLLEKMAEDLAASRDPWARHWLVLAGTGRSEWLQRRWARLAGIAAHSQIVSLRSLVEQVASPEREPFSRDRLVLAVAHALPSVAHRTPLPINTDCTTVTARVLAWSQQVADAIDMGLMCRSAERRFVRAPFLAELVEHPNVNAALCGHLGMLDTDAYVAAVRQWIDRWNRRGGVPRLWIQLDAGLPPLIMRCLADLIDQVPDRVHLSLLSPSLNYWGDLKLRRRWNESEDAGPVLTSLGRQTQDLHNQSIDRFLSHGGGGSDLPSAATATCLLGRLHQACRQAAVPGEPQPLCPNDWSFTVHACRSPLRELEVGHDRILQAMSEDPTLMHDDILVLLADPATHAPFVEAAMAPLPVRMIGLGATVASPFATALLRLLKTLDGRLGIADFQAILEEPLILSRFSLQDHAADVLAWLEQAQFRWGLDPKQRAEFQGDGEARWNLAFALRRLGLGAIVSASLRDGIVDGAAPLERATGLSTILLAHLAEFATALYEARRCYVAGAGTGGTSMVRSMAQWRDLLLEWCDKFFADDDGVIAEHRTQFTNRIIPSLVAATPEGLLLTGEAVQKLLKEAFESFSSTQGAGSGGITVADLRQYAGTPARMVTVIGLANDAFPAHDERPVWHPLAENREVGDPDRREADRHALLLALLGCSERCALIYQGGSDQDGKERPPATPLADLLAAVDAVATGPGSSSAAATVLIRHGLNGFSPAACATAASPILRTHRPSDYAAASALLTSTWSAYPGPWSQPLPSNNTPSPLTLRTLFDLVDEPCKLFVRSIGLQLPEELDAPAQTDCLALDALARWKLRDRLLESRLTKTDPLLLRARAEAAGELPRGCYGETIWQELLRELPEIDEDAVTRIVETAPVQVGARVINPRLPPGWYRARDHRLIYCTASTRGKKQQLYMRIALMCLVLTETVSSVDTWFSKDRKPRPVPVPSRAHAIDALSALCQVSDLGERIPLPFWSEIYHQLRSIEERAKKDSSVDSSPSRLLQLAWSIWNNGNPAFGEGAPARQLPATRLCFRGLEDPFDWTPAIDIGWLPEPTKPLAWRLFRFFSQWEASSGTEPSA